MSQRVPSQRKIEGAPVTVGTAAVQLTFARIPSSIHIQADHDNTGSIWIGADDITSTGLNAFIRLDAGEGMGMDYNPIEQPIYAVASAAAQKVYKLALVY